MELRERPRRKPAEGVGSYARQCEAPGCTSSARFDMVLLDTEHTLLCKGCAQAWADAYEHALRGWPDEPAAKLAADYRARRAA
jgi:hypothetical protein